MGRGLRRAPWQGVIGITVKPGDSDSKVLAYLLRNELLSFKEVELWAFSQYTDDDIDPLIEEISFAIDKGEIYGILEEYGFEISHEFLVGKAAQAYEESGSFSEIENYISEFIWNDDLDYIKLPKKEAENIYNTYKHYYNTIEAGCLDHIIESAREKCIEVILPLFEKYLPIYKKSIAKFNL